METLKAVKITKPYENAKKHAINGRIYCHCIYAWKDNLKKLGFKWSPEYKLWYIPIVNFSEEIYNKTQEIRFTNKTTIGDLNYYYVYYQTKEEIEEKTITQPTNKVRKFDFTNYAF